MIERDRPFGAEPAPAVATPASPLYLCPEGPTRVRLDGPALAVARDGEAERLFPLGRIARIHSGPRAQWEQAALLACAEAGIPVQFIDADGAVRARLLGRPGARDELRNRLLPFLLRPEAPGMLNHWLGQTRQRAARWAGLKLGYRPPPAAARPRDRAQDIRRWINTTADRLAGADAALHTRQWQRTLAYGWMEAHLADLGLARNTELGAAGTPALAAELAAILHWYLEPARLGWLRRRAQAARHRGEPVRPPTHRETVHLIASREARLAQRGREITGSLHRWLIHET